MGLELDDGPVRGLCRAHAGAPRRARSPVAGAARGAVVPPRPVGRKCPAPGGDYGPGAPRVGGLSVVGGSTRWHRPAVHMVDRVLGMPVEAHADARELPAGLPRPLSALRPGHHARSAPPRRGPPNAGWGPRHARTPWQGGKGAREPARPPALVVSATPSPAGVSMGNRRS